MPALTLIVALLLLPCSLRAQTFTEVGASAGVNNNGNGAGVAWGDYNHDGFLDLFVANSLGPNRLYRNNGDGTFTEVGASAGIASSNGGAGAWGDYDNDGDLDLYIATVGQLNPLYRNNGDGTFTDVGASAEVNEIGTGRSVVWGDYNNDGWLDLFVMNSGPTRLYRNNGNGTFTDVTTSAGVNREEDFHGGAWGDYDNDGYLDFYLAYRAALPQLPGPHGILFHNNKDGTFTDVTTSAGVTNPGGDGHGVAWGDYNNDGYLDLYVSNEGVNRLYRNNGDGTFTDVAASAGVNATGNGLGVAWIDYNNDGWLDLSTVFRAGPNLLYRNNGDGTFTEVGGSLGLTAANRQLSVAWGDYNNDGSLDFYVTDENGNNTLFRNNGTANRWLEVNLVGTVSNRDGIGARVIAVTGLLRQRRDIDGGSGFLSQSSLPVEFGFGSTTTVDSLLIRWPSGMVQTLTNVATNQTLTVMEPAPPVTFTEVGASAGVDHVGDGQHVAWGDYDHDGDPDLLVTYISQFDQHGPTRLYRNNGNGTFTNVTAMVGIAENQNDRGAGWADYDNDGDLDLYIAVSVAAHRLYRNNGNGTFTNVAAAAGVENSSGDGSGVAWGDYDHDGWLDLMVATLNGNRLYRNMRDGTFTDVTSAAGVTEGGRSAVWGDYDRDGDLDLYVCKEGTNQLYRNNGNGTFTEVGAAAGVNDSGNGNGAIWGDYNQDGWLDLYVVNFEEANRLYRNNGNGTFTDIGAAAGVHDSGNGVAAVWGDYDADGMLDLYLANWGPNRLYRNQGDGTFTELGASLGVNDPGQGDDVMWSDYDGDGDLDLYLINTNGSPNRLYRNNGSSHRWLQLHLQGTVSNRNGIGARITVVTGLSHQYRDVDGGVGYGAQSALPTMFGLGDTALIDSLIISWPSGQVQVLTNVATNHILTMTEPAPVTFTEVGASAGVNTSGGGVGVAWGDYDHDGDLDLYVVKAPGANVLYRNNGNGTFTEVGATAGVNDSQDGRGAAWGDYDNDGDLDLYLSTLRFGPNRLYRNNGDGTFTDVGATAGVDDTGDTYEPAWGDYDNDGDLDLYLPNTTTPNRLYRNEGNGTFTDVGASAGVNDSGLSLGVAWGDYDDDGDLDLYVANNNGPNLLYRNDGTGTFTDVGASAGVNDAGAGFGAAWGDYDHDGDLDLYVANEGSPNRLYRNNGNGTFTEVGGSAGVNDSGNGHGIAWGDYDHDGNLDLYVANANQPNLLYHNNGDGTFTDLAPSVGLNDSGPGHGVAWGDYDQDGDLDLYVTNAEVGPNLLYRNNGTPNRWLIVTLVGILSNRSGIGARVVAVTGPTRQRRDVDGGSGFLSQPSLPVEFGFGSATTVDELTIHWPSGIVQTLTNVATNQLLIVTETPPAPRVSVQPLKLNFGNVQAGTAKMDSVCVINTGAVPLLISGIAVPPPESVFDVFLDVAFPLVLEPAQRHYFHVTFTPETAGFVADSLWIVTNDPAQPEVRVRLCGQGVRPYSMIHFVDAFARPGGHAVVDVVVNTDQWFAGLQFKIQPYCNGNPSWYVHFNGLINDLESDGWTASFHTDQDGVTTVLFFHTGGGALSPYEDHRILELVFDIDPTIPFGKWIDLVTWEIVLSNPSSQPIPFNLWQGTIHIGHPGDIAGGQLGGGDGHPDILDLIKLVKKLIGLLPQPEWGSFEFFLCDVNGDGYINILDLVALINNILNEQGTPKVIADGPTSPVTVSLAEVQTLAGGQLAVPVTLTTNGSVAGVQATFTFDAAQLQLGTPQLIGAAAGMTLQSQIVDGKLQIIIYSASGQVIPAGSGATLVIPATLLGEGAPELTLAEVLLADRGAQAIPVVLGTSTVKVAPLPTAFGLKSARPNPFNPTTRIAYDVPQAAHIVLAVYNLLGQEVARLVDEPKTSGRYVVTWDGRNGHGEAVASGVYLYRLTSSTGFSQTHRMTLLK